MTPRQPLEKNGARLTRPIFILSCERSGSTLLRYIVDTHPDIACPPEPSLGELCFALYHTTFLLSQAAASDEIERSIVAVERARQVIGDLMADYAAAKGKKLWCDKSPGNLQHLEMLDMVFPDAKYICLHRNCMDVVHSCLEVSQIGFMAGLVPYVRKSPENLVAAMVESWTDRTRQLLAFERAHRGKCLRITYEEIVLDTVTALKGMFAFLGVPFDPRLTDSVFTVRHDIGPGDDRIRFSKEISKRSLGKGSRVARTLIPADLLDQMNGLLSELSYPTVGPNWNSVPSPYLPPPAAADDTAATTTIDEIFKSHWPALLKNQRSTLGEIRGVCRFAVSGEGGGDWIVNLTERSVRRDGGEVKPDCVVALSATDFIDLVGGRLNAISAFDRGQVVVTGNVALVKRIGELLFGT